MTKCFIRFFSVMKGTPISGCIGDQQAALVGQNCLRPGQAKVTYGTGCFMLYNVGPRIVRSNNGLISTVAYQMGPSDPVIYALEVRYLRYSYPPKKTQIFTKCVNWKIIHILGISCNGRRCCEISSRSVKHFRSTKRY